MRSHRRSKPLHLAGVAALFVGLSAAISGISMAAVGATVWLIQTVASTSQGTQVVLGCTLTAICLATICGMLSRKLVLASITKD